MKTIEPTLIERAGRMYRQLLILQRLFEHPADLDPNELRGADDRAKHLAFFAAVREVIDELTEHAELLTSIPFPLCEWQPGNGPDDERWRALTEVERREVLSMLAGYERLISWAEESASGAASLHDRLEAGSGSLEILPSGNLATLTQPRREARDYLSAERSRVGRFRQEMTFLERRRGSAE